MRNWKVQAGCDSSAEVMSEKWMTHKKYKSSRKPVLAGRLDTTKEDARGGVEAAVSEKDLCQVSEVKGNSESAYDVRDGTCEDGDRSGCGPDSSGE
jgi:hypothetical protein